MTPATPTPPPSANPRSHSHLSSHPHLPLGRTKRPTNSCSVRTQTICYNIRTLDNLYPPGSLLTTTGILYMFNLEENPHDQDLGWFAPRIEEMKRRTNMHIWIEHGQHESNVEFTSHCQRGASGDFCVQVPQDSCTLIGTLDLTGLGIPFKYAVELGWKLA